MTGADLAAAAEALVGTRFRLHGRDPASGLDCIGVLAASLAACGRKVALPNHYALRAHRLPDLSSIIESCDLIAVEGEAVSGDIVMVRIGPCQFHLLIAASSDRFVHAHAGLRQVVCSEKSIDWVTEGHWRPNF
jgi:hypothetical protein